MTKIKALYIHIPFCNQICTYCDFPKGYYNEDLANKYLDALEKEYYELNINKTHIKSIYIGGGTPSSLNYLQLERLFSFLKIDEFKQLKEFTIEVNPDSVDIDKIALFKKYHINRISLGVQTFDNELLLEINRNYTKNDCLEVISNLKDNGFNNISIDLMYGLPKQSLDSLKNDLSILKELDINHIALYSLILEENTLLYNQGYVVDEDIENELNEYINNQLLKLGYNHYEVSNYSKSGYESLHNLVYWNNEYYYGIGLGSCMYIDNNRIYNTKSITNYIKNEYNRVYEKYNSINDILVNEIILSFRKFNGIDINHINNKFNIDFKIMFQNAINLNKDMLYLDKDMLYFSDKGKRYLNDVINSFLDEIEG